MRAVWDAGSKINKKIFAKSTLRLDSISRTQHAAYSESEFVKVWCMISQLCWRKPIWMQIFLISCCQTRTILTSSSKLKHKKFVNNFFPFQCSAFFVLWWLRHDRRDTTSMKGWNKQKQSGKNRIINIPFSIFSLLSKHRCAWRLGKSLTFSVTCSLTSSSQQQHMTKRKFIIRRCGHTGNWKSRKCTKWIFPTLKFHIHDSISNDHSEKTKKKPSIHIWMQLWIFLWFNFHLIIIYVVAPSEQHTQSSPRKGKSSRKDCKIFSFAQISYSLLVFHRT